MTKISNALVRFVFIIIFLHLTAGAAQSEFIPVDPAAFDTISGKKLMIISYGVILGLLLAYTIFTLMRQRAVNRAILRLENQIISG
jgi:hypothetical protein